MRSTRATVKRRSTALPARPTISVVKVTPPPPVPNTHTPTGTVPQADPTRLPYSAHQERFVAASDAHELAMMRRRKSSRGWLRAVCSGLLHYVTGHQAVAAATPGLMEGLHPGDILRDFPFFTQASEVSYFSTHPSLCDAIFTVGHGDRLRFGSGQWATQEATVVGARGGHLWIVLDGDTIARQLPSPADLSSMAWQDDAAAVTSPGETPRAPRGGPSRGDYWSRVQAYYAIQRLSDTAGPLPASTPAADRPSGPDTALNTSTSTSAPDAPRELEPGLSPRVLARVDEAARRIHSAEQRSFLQRAPDLFVSVVSEGEVSMVSPFLPGGAGSGEVSPTSPFQGTPSRSSQASGSASPWGVESPADMHKAAGDLLPREADQRGALRAPLPFVVPGAEQVSSLYAMVANGGEDVAGKVVLLAPRILAVSGTAGWAGEGTVVAEAGGIHHFKASLSASLVCS